ncbi:MAG: RNase J family beta-CASP ribonuclease [Candidatus Moranbacteria bacterium]|nr:RNase J family beta-CASP ribonuclease [Candidatus Moranbacteria bacterium]
MNTAKDKKDDVGKKSKTSSLKNKKKTSSKEVKKSKQKSKTNKKQKFDGKNYHQKNRGGQEKKYQAGGYLIRGQNLPRRNGYEQNNHISQSQKDKKNKGKLRIIPLGGLEEIGRNMTVFEYDKDIIIVDMGMQFPDEEMPGIDYVIPNSRYLRDKVDRIRGVFITHGHLDHIGAIPHHIKVLGNPPIYAGRMTKAIIAKRQEEHKDNPKLNIKEVLPKEKVRLGNFEIEFIHVCHSIPDALGMAIHSPVGTVIHSGDFKFDQSPIGEEPTDIGHLALIASKGVLALMADSTDAGLSGFTISESKVKDAFEKIIQNAKGRIIAGTFSTLITRIRHMVEISEKYGKKIAIDGYSMKTNVEIAREMGYIKARKETFIDISQVNNYPKNKIIVMCTGAQGEGNAVLMRIANEEHRYVQPEKGDTIIFSSSVIPGNERTVQAVKDNLYKKGVHVIHYKMMDVHSGGHAKSEDLKLMLNLIKPRYLIPIHGNHFMLRLHGELAMGVGMHEQNVLIAENGKVIEFDRDSKGRITDEKVPANYVMVDGLGVGDIGNVVLRERLQMAQDGMFVIIVTIDSKNGDQIGNADLISRGFIYMKNNQELLKQTRYMIRDIIHKKTGGHGAINWEYVRNSIRDDIGQFLFNKTQRRPMVLPVIIEV